MDQGLSLLLVAIAGVVMASLLLFVIIKGLKTNKDYGRPALKGLTKQEMFIFAGFALMIAVTEALNIGTFHSDDDSFPYLARITVHLLIAILSWFCILVGIQKFSDFFTIILGFINNEVGRQKHLKKLKKAKIGPAKILNILAFALFITIAGIGFPLINLVMLALSMDSMLQVELWTYNLVDSIPFVNRVPLSEIVTKIPVADLGYTALDTTKYTGEFLPSNYNPFYDMPYRMQVMLIQVSVVQGLALIKGWLTILHGDYISSILDPSSYGTATPNTPGAASTSSSSSSSSSSAFTAERNDIQQVLIYYGYDLTTERTIVDRKVDAAIQVIQGISDFQQRANLISKVTALKSGWAGVDKTNATEMQTWRTDVQALWQKPTTTGQGFGGSLKTIT